MQTLRSYVDTYPTPATQRQWAAFFGISQAFFSQILRGDRLPGRETMMRIEKRTRGEVPVIVWFLTDHEIAAVSAARRGEMASDAA